MNYQKGLLIPAYSLSPSRATFFYLREGFEKRNNAIQNTTNFEGGNSPKFSKNSQRNLRKLLEWFCFCAAPKTFTGRTSKTTEVFRIAFVTLTLPSKQQHSDNEIKSYCLNQFFIEARNLWKLKNYVWRAEKQKNGNIHIHLFVDVFIPMEQLRDTWNRIINKLGYVSIFQDQMKEKFKKGFTATEEELKKWSKAVLVSRYEKGKVSNWANPNSTDVKRVKNLKQALYYASKYMCKVEKKKEENTEEKKEEKQEIEGRYWYASEGLIKTCKNIIIDANHPQFLELDNLISNNAGLRINIEAKFVQIFAAGLSWIVENTHRIRYHLLTELDRIRNEITGVCLDENYSCLTELD